MARFTRIQVYNQIRETGIIPLFYHQKIEICFNIIKACYAGGTRVFEFTNRGDYAHEVFGELNKRCQKELPDLILGVGTIVDGPTASLYIQLGTNFIVTPTLVEELAPVCQRRKVAWIPGAGSVTEISRAEELGAEIIKIFPATQVGGPEFIKAVKGPMPWTNIMPSGGVKPEENNIKAWFEAGAFCLGMGSQLMVKNKNDEYDYPEIERLMRLSIEWAAKYRKS
jgi:2-dehydro-3-deoxyphosphogluconate aldolase / (4S)-4-hydroxy-2-oxoglutarate aldolase